MARVGRARASASVINKCRPLAAHLFPDGLCVKQPDNSWHHSLRSRDSLETAFRNTKTTNTRPTWIKIERYTKTGVCVCAHTHTRTQHTHIHTHTHTHIHTHTHTHTFTRTHSHSHTHSSIRCGLALTSITAAELTKREKLRDTFAVLPHCTLVTAPLAVRIYAPKDSPGAQSFFFLVTR